jgi:steroid delta-isomerase-like uncharacterized protein
MHEGNIDALLAAWNEGDLDGLDAAASSDTVRRAPASTDSDANNLAELKQVITDFRTAYPDAHVHLEEITYDGDRSYARWTFTGTNTGPGDHPPTGKSVSVPGASFGRYADGKMTEELVYFDALDMMAQLGLIDMPEG